MSDLICTCCSAGDPNKCTQPRIIQISSETMAKKEKAMDSMAQQISELLQAKRELLDALEVCEKKLTDEIRSEDETTTNPNPEEDSEVVMNARAAIAKHGGH